METLTNIKVNRVYPKDIYINMDISLDMIRKLKLAYDISTIVADTPEKKEATDCLTKEFYPFLCDIIEEVEGNK